MNVTYNLFLKYFLFVIFISFTGVGHVYGGVSLSTQNLFLALDETINVVLNATNLTKTPFTLMFDAEQLDVISLHPSYVVFNTSNEEHNLTIYALGAGHTDVIAAAHISINLSKVHFTVNVCRSKILDVISQIVGWIFIISWGCAFYPQIYSNFKRQCVIGLNFDYLAFKIVGYVSFSVFILNLYFNPTIQKEYFEKYPRGLIPVKLNDVVYSIHGVLAILVLVFQCCIYERGDQKVSTTAKVIIGSIMTLYTVCIVLKKYSVMQWLDFLYICSYIKIIITFLKYIPQAYMNYKRKSTSGWSIGLVFLDFNGGFFSIMQMVFDAYNYDDWASIFGNPTKFLLGFMKIIFHTLFMVQHFALYKDSGYTTFV